MSTPEIAGTFESPDQMADDRRHESRTPLMLAAWMWRTRAPARPIAIRILEHAGHSVGFISPVTLERGESFDLALDRTSPRLNLRVLHCESLCEDTFRIGACS